MKSLIENFADYLIAGGMAAAGGFLRILRQSDRKSIAAVIVEMIAAGFAGILINALLREFSVDHEIKIFLVGIAGYSAGEFLEIMRRTGINMLDMIIRHVFPDAGRDGKNSKKSGKNGETE